MQQFDSLSEIQAALMAGQISCRTLVETALERYHATTHLNAFVEVWPDEALCQADLIDQKIRSGARPGRLFGAIISLKDNICYAGHTVTAASKILEGYVPPYSATAVERLILADAIILGRTNCDQFGMGSSNENSVYGPVRNAADPERVAGGSSGGAAVSVQTRCCHIAIGTDTGGSIRQPAGFCGLWGLKPTYGRISRHGLIAYGSSFDQIGFIGRHAADLALALEVCAGPDQYDATASCNELAPEFPQTGAVKIACFLETISQDGLDAGVRAQTRAFINRLMEMGHVVDEISFQEKPGDAALSLAVPAYYVLTTAEASSNLARFDGVRYGYRSPEAHDLHSTYVYSRTEGLSDEVKRRILLGTFVLSSGYYDAYYARAQKVRRRLRDRLKAVLAQYDFILMPVAPMPAWRFGEKSADPVAMYLADIYTVLANLAGLPAMTIPAGLDAATGMPVGVQLMADEWNEARLLGFGMRL